jgi:hypothetical protein
MAQACRHASTLAATWQTPAAKSRKRYIINSYTCIFHLGYRPILPVFTKTSQACCRATPTAYHPHMLIKTLGNTHNINRQGLVV